MYSLSGTTSHPCRTGVYDPAYLFPFPPHKPHFTDYEYSYRLDDNARKRFRMDCGNCGVCLPSGSHYSRMGSVGSSTVSDYSGYLDGQNSVCRSRILKFDICLNFVTAIFSQVLLQALLYFSVSSCLCLMVSSILCFAMWGRVMPHIFGFLTVEMYLLTAVRMKRSSGASHAICRFGTGASISLS